MPFIYNDEQRYFIGDNEKYNTKEFVVVRKLFIEFQDTVSRLLFYILTICTHTQN